MSYQPNFNDPRVVKRIRRAVGFSCSVFDEAIPRAWSTRHLDKYFGFQTTDIAKYLRKQLLTATKITWNKDTGDCKQYVLNPDGVDYLTNMIGIKSPIAPKADKNEIINDWITTDFGNELSTGNFTYEERSNRLWHPIQNIPSGIRKSLMAEHGFKYDYDIMACAPTLLLQYAKKCGLTEKTPQIDLMLEDRHSYRQAISEGLEIDEKRIKKVINALFAGAYLSHNPETSLYVELQGNHNHIDALKQSLQPLRDEIKLLWDVITTTLPRTTMIDKRGLERKQAVSSKTKWRTYFELENEVMTSVRKYLKKNRNEFFSEHDGWRCKQVIDINELRTYVRTQTGYVIDIDWEIVH